MIILLLLLLLSHFSRVRLCATPETAAHQAPPSLGFSRQEHWSGLPFPSPMHESEKWKWSRSVVSNSSDPIDCSLPGSSVHGIFQAKVLEWGAIAFSDDHLEWCLKGTDKIHYPLDLGERKHSTVGTKVCIYTAMLFQCQYHNFSCVICVLISTGKKNPILFIPKGTSGSFCQIIRKYTLLFICFILSLLYHKGFDLTILKYINHFLLIIPIVFFL